MTSFAITGIKYSKSSSFHGYRPNYSSALPPIYEDVTILQAGNQQHHTDAQLNVSDTAYPNHNRTLHRSVTFHNYAHVTDFPTYPEHLRSETEGTSQDQGRQLDRKGSKIGRYMKRKFTKNKSHGHHKATQSLAKEQAPSDAPPNELNNHRGMTKMPSDGSLSKPTKQPVNTSVVGDIRRESSSSLYKVNPGMGTLLNRSYGYNHDLSRRGTEDLDSVFRWPKLDPEPPSETYLMCPAEKKFKHRLFVVCYVTIILLVMLMVFVTINGWIYPNGDGEVSVNNIVKTIERPFLTMYNLNESDIPDINDGQHMYDGQDV